MSWGDDVAFDTATATRDADDGGALASQVLGHRQEHLLLELGELRARLTRDAGSEQRRGWG